MLKPTDMLKLTDNPKSTEHVKTLRKLQYDLVSQAPDGNGKEVMAA